MNKVYQKFLDSYQELTPTQHAHYLKLWTDYKDLNAKQELVNNYQRLVVKHALKLKKSRISLMDLIQEGNLGLLLGLEKYNPSLNVPLIAYVKYWIDAYMLRYIKNNGFLLKIATTPEKTKAFWKLSSTQASLESKGIEASHEALAEALNISKETVETVSRFNTEIVSLDEDTIASVSVEDEIESALNKNKLLDYVDQLKDRLNLKQKVILERRLLQENPDTLEAVGFELGLTRQRVQQIEAKLKEQLSQIHRG